jgi:hypothetical protein
MSRARARSRDGDVNERGGSRWPSVDLLLVLVVVVIDDDAGVVMAVCSVREMNE